MEAGGSSSSSYQQIRELLRSLPPEELLRSLPPGFRFIPRDEELIEDYLQKKIDGVSIPINIPDVPFAATNPHTLTEQYPKTGDNGWYFFVTRVRKGEQKSSRRVEDGYWRIYDQSKPVRSNMGKGEVIGYRRTLEFFEEVPIQTRGGNKKKSMWRMREYYTKSKSVNAVDDKDRVICRIFELTKQEKNAASSNPDLKFLQESGGGSGSDLGSDLGSLLSLAQPGSSSFTL